MADLGATVVKVEKVKRGDLIRFTDHMVRGKSGYFLGINRGKRGITLDLRTPEGQEIAARRFYRPRNPAVAAKYKAQFPNVSLFTIDAVFGGWAKAQKIHFADGGIFDQIYQAGR